jgi:hypothetical protein
MYEHPWCHPAHCMQAQTFQYATQNSHEFRSATSARDVLVLVSLPLLLNGSTVRDACLTR